MSVLDSFENKTRIVEENCYAKLVFEGMEIDVSKRLIYRGNPLFSFMVANNL